MTRALEFIYGASDLIECGWKLPRYAESGGGNHPFAQLLQTWSQEVAALKTEIATRGR